MNVIVSAADWKVLRPIVVAGIAAALDTAADDTDPEQARARELMAWAVPWTARMDARYPAAR